jgi:hypothetical protein
MALVNHHDRSNTQDSVVNFLCHVSMISPTISCIHPILLSQRISSPIAPMLDSVWKFLPQWGMSSLTLRFEKILFHSERSLELQDQKDRVMKRNTSTVMKGNLILQGVAPPPFVNLRTIFLLRGRAATPRVVETLIIFIKAIIKNQVH